MQQVVPDGPDGHEFAYVVEAADGRLSVHAGRAEHPDVTFTQDRATALAIHRGELSAQAAFMEGRLRLGGDLRDVIRRAGALAALDDVFAQRPCLSSPRSKRTPSASTPPSPARRSNASPPWPSPP